MTEREIWFAAFEIFKQKQELALLAALRKEVELSETGDQIGAEVWQRIADAIEFLQSQSGLSPYTEH